MNLISGHGPSHPAAFLVADFAQGEDLKSGYALSGYKENILRKMCHSAKFDYKALYKTCLIKTDLPPLKGVKLKKNATDSETSSAYIKEVVPQFSEFLKGEITELKPNLVVPLGETSFQFLTGLSGIRKFRGSILPANPALGIGYNLKVLPVLGPYPYLYQEYKQNIISTLDFKKIPKWWDDKPVPDDTFRIWICKSSTAFRNFVERSYPVCAAKSIFEGGFLVFDIETYMNIPTCISFCFDGFESCCVPLIDNSIEEDQLVLLWQQVSKLLASPIPKVNQNIKYDWKTLERFKFRVNNVVGDTMLAASTLYCEFPKNLGFLTSIYTDIPYFKDEGRQFDPAIHSKERFYLYNAKDSLATHQIYSKQLPETDELGTSYVYQNLVKLIPIYRRAEDRGIRIDEEKRDFLFSKYSSLYYIHRLNLQRLTNHDHINPLSSPVMNRLVFDVLGYEKIRGVKGSDRESLNMLKAKGSPKHCSPGLAKEILNEIATCRRIHKVIEILNLDLYPDGRFRGEFNLAGTETGRSSGSKTSDYFIYPVDTPKGQKVKTINLGHSLQTLGKHGFFIEGELYGTDIRDMFVASRGYTFVEIDLSGAEARVDRVLSGNFDLSVFEHPGIHKLTGSWLFGTDPSNIKKNTIQYHLSKITRHAGERNMKEGRLFSMAQDDGVGLSLSLTECRDLLEKKFHPKEPGIRKVFHADIKTALESTRCLVAPNGRRRDFFDRIDFDTINEGISQLPQAIVSDQTKFSFIPTFNEAAWANLLVEAHDGSLTEVPMGRERSFYETYKRNIETPIDFRQGTLKRDYQLVIPCEASVGESWGQMEDLK